MHVEQQRQLMMKERQQKQAAALAASAAASAAPSSVDSSNTPSTLPTAATPGSSQQQQGNKRQLTLTVGSTCHVSSSLKCPSKRFFHSSIHHSFYDTCGQKTNPFSTGWLISELIIALHRLCRRNGFESR